MKNDPCKTNQTELLDSKTNTLRSHLSIKTMNLLSVYFPTLRDLVKKSSSDLIKYRNFGKKTISEIEGALDKVGLKLGMEF
ncbi:MAG: DNA-directed RNA polymerase subunit alpha C-terminal domain-containing protein [bacterium]